MPILKIYIPSKPDSYPSTTDSIYIPKINASSPLIDNVNPWNETEYRTALKHGVAIAKGFSKPGSDGVIFIFAHSSDSPWNISSYNTVFFRLGELKPDDLIVINYGGQKYQYKVDHTIEVWPNEVEQVTKQSENVLILQTCTPVGTSLRRILVFAKPI